MSWSDGYFTHLDYANHYISYISPLSILLNLTFAGVRVGKCDSIAPIEDFSYLELGFGLGTSLNIHALSNSGFFIGTDFNPNHTLFAQNIANITQANLKLFDEGFREFLETLETLHVKFDFIVLHGVWSWINAKNQTIVLEIIKKFLKVGGIVYNGYNCYPGWSNKRPMGELLRFCFENTSGDVSKRIKTSLNFLETFYGMQNDLQSKQWQEIIRDLKTKSQSYVAHEYLNADWNCCYFYEMVESMQKAKCTFGASAKILDHFDSSLESFEIPLLSNENEFKEQLRDFLLHRQFRSDLFLRGKVLLMQNEGIAKIQNTPFVLIANKNSFKPLKTPYSQVIDTHCLKILEFLFSNKAKPKFASDIMTHCNLCFSELSSALALLISQDVVSPCLQNIATKIIKQTQKYNTYLLNTPLENYVFFASALIGGGVKVSKQHALLIHGILQKHTTQQSLEEFVALKYPNSAISSLEIKNFIETDLLIYQSLGIC